MPRTRVQLEGGGCRSPGHCPGRGLPGAPWPEEAADAAALATATSVVRGLETALTGGRWAPTGVSTRDPSARTERTQARLVRPFPALQEQVPQARNRKAWPVLATPSSGGTNAGTPAPVTGLWTRGGSSAPSMNELTARPPAPARPVPSRQRAPFCDACAGSLISVCSGHVRVTASPLRTHALQGLPTRVGVEPLPHGRGPLPSPSGTDLHTRTHVHTHIHTCTCTHTHAHTRVVTQSQ